MTLRERSASRPDAARPIPPDLAALYSPLFEIGRGGMGTIEVALEAPSERIVALKLMHPQATRERRQTEAFLREARLAVMLVHPNVVHAFDYGEVDGELFLAMEYVEGETLSAIVRTARARMNGDLPPALVASILADTCEGLHAAHELRDAQGALLNVIHRDVSPHNVMVSYEGHVKLLDFGVAKIDSIDPLTRTGEVKGKTAYMSPEQAMGETLDRRSDLYSLGAVLFECVSGQRMYGNGTDLDVLRKLALEEAPSLAAAAPLAPPELVSLHARLVARTPDKRPATALAVAQELREFVAKSGVRADAVAIAETMGSLFAVEAAERKRLLNEALAKTMPPGTVEVLRRSLAGPTALSAVDGRRHAPRVFTPSPPPPSLPPMGEPLPARATKTGVIASAVIGLLIAGGIVAVSARGSTQAPPVVLDSPPNTTSTSTSTSTPPSTSTSTPPSTLPSTAAPISTPTPSSPPHPRPHHPKPSSSAPHVDVDPNPL